MLVELERPAMKGPGHVKGGITVFEAAVAERHDDFPLRHDMPVEIGNAVIAPGLAHPSAPICIPCSPQPSALTQATAPAQLLGRLDRDVLEGCRIGEAR